MIILKIQGDDFQISGNSKQPNFLELGVWAGFGMYEEFGGASAAGVVTGFGAG